MSMTDIRDSVSFSGIDQHATTFKHTGLTASDAPTGGYPENPGSAVSLASSQTVSRGSAGDRLFGRVEVVESDSKAAILDRGYMRFVYAGTPPTIGASVECNGDGRVRVATSNNVARGNTVVEIDGTTVTCVVRLN